MLLAHPHSARRCLTLDRLIESRPNLRKASDLSQAEVSRVLQEHSGNLSTAADALHISVLALQLRLNARRTR
jgi:ActR/RegA family two-component response regulator